MARLSALLERKGYAMQEMTLCFLIEGDPAREILLGRKRVGFGADKYAGFGGKIEPGETATAAAARELAEETGIRVSEADLCEVAHITFLFPARPEWSQVVHVFRATHWSGDPGVSAEMWPSWFAADEIPFDRMWPDSVYWLPYVLAGKRIKAEITLNEDNETVERVRMAAWEDDR